MKRFETVDEYILNHQEWSKSLDKLRNIILSFKLVETVKWSAPVYTHNGKNIVGLAAFKSYVGLWFFQGGLLEDKESKLINAQEGKTQALRQWRFESLQHIEEDLIRLYIAEAIQNQELGKEIKPDRNKPLHVPKELADVLEKNPSLKRSFNEFTLSKKREFTTYIEDAKREETKLKRLDKIIPMIMEKKGLHDKYRNC